MAVDYPGFVLSLHGIGVSKMDVGHQLLVDRIRQTTASPKLADFSRYMGVQHSWRAHSEDPVELSWGRPQLKGSLHLPRVIRLTT